MRTFIAVKIEPQKKLIDVISKFRKALGGENISWTDINNLHLTLRFIGETNEAQVKLVSKLLGEVTTHVAPFNFGIKGAGFFKGSNQPRVLFLNIDNDIVLKQLAIEIENMMVLNNFLPAERSFRSHLTIGRIKTLQNKNAFYTVVNEFKFSEIQQVKITEIIFYQSILSPAGAIYNPIQILPLTKIL